jgi:hypothetical protein
MFNTWKALVAAIDAYLDWHYEYEVLSPGRDGISYPLAARGFWDRNYSGATRVHLPDDIPHPWVRQGALAAEEYADNTGEAMSYRDIVEYTIVMVVYDRAEKFEKRKL